MMMNGEESTDKTLAVLTLAVLLSIYELQIAAFSDSKTNGLAILGWCVSGGLFVSS